MHSFSESNCNIYWMKTKILTYKKKDMGIKGRGYPNKGNMSGISCMMVNGAPMLKPIQKAILQII